MPPRDTRVEVDDIKETVVKYFLEVDYQGDGARYAKLLLDCDFYSEGGHYIDVAGELSYAAFRVIIEASPQAYHLFTLPEGAQFWRLVQALSIAALDNHNSTEVDLVLKRQPGKPGWTDALRKSLSGEEISNQGALIRQPPVIHGNLRFRSYAEVKISEALRKQNLMFFPLPVACFREHDIEPDFLVFHEGRVGLLEVDGDPYHRNAVRDQQRDELYQRYGIKWVKHVDATECHNDAERVVTGFLDWLRRMYKQP